MKDEILAIRLYGGRKDKNEPLDGEGFNGPVIGPVKFFEMSYVIATDITFEDDERLDEYVGLDKDGNRFGFRHEDGLIFYNGEWFGQFYMSLMQTKMARSLNTNYRAGYAHRHGINDQ